ATTIPTAFSRETAARIRIGTYDSSIALRPGLCEFLHLAGAKIIRSAATCQERAGSGAAAAGRPGRGGLQRPGPAAPVGAILPMKDPVPDAGGAVPPAIR